MKGYRVVLGVFLVIALIAAAAVGAWMAYNAGLTQGAAQAEGASASVVPYAVGGPYGMPPFGFGFLGCLVPLAFLCLVFSLFRLVAWGGMRRHMHEDCGSRGGPMYDRMRERWHQRMEEWHREAHAAGSGQPPAQGPSA